MNVRNNCFKKIIFTAFFSLVITAVNISAATFTVTNTNDSGAGSLRQAVLDANAAAGDDTIAFDASFNMPRTITLASIITITGNGGLTINGTGAQLLTISGNNATNIFQLSGLNSPQLGAIIFNNLTLADGLSFDSSQPDGGAISINDGASGPTYTAVNFTANNVVFRNNNGGVNDGGAIGCRRNGTINVNNSVFTLNRSNGGSAIDGGSGNGTCSINVNNSSFYENSVTGGDNVIRCCGNGSGTVSISNSAFYNNGRNGGTYTIRFGGGENTGNVSITNTTIANNRGNVAALFWGVNNASVSLTLSNVTIAGNYSSSANTAAGFQTANINVLQIRNSIIADNFNPSGPNDVVIGASTTFTSQGYNLLETVQGTISGNTTGNLIGVDPWLDGTMRDNGGATKTLALRPGSPAIDAGDPTTFPATDQRGITRPQDGDGAGGARSDIGAYERRPTDTVGPGTRFDFDGDNKTDIGIFRPGPGEWWIRRSSNNQVVAAQFGSSADKIVPADFTGDGKTDIALFRPSVGQWFVLRSEDNSFYAFPFGSNGDKAVPADFDGDGKADPTVFRPSNSVWYSLRSSDGQVAFQQFGIAEDVPLPNDFDGDGKADFGVFRPTPSEWWILKSTGGVSAFQFGSTGDKPAPADFTGDGRTDVAFWRPSDGFWYVLRSEDNSFYAFPFGSTGDTPVTGDYDGDGRADAAVFRPSNSTWYLQQTTNGFTAVAFGSAGDNPIPAAYSP